MPRGTYFRGPEDSECRRKCLEQHSPSHKFDWVREPVLNPLTRLAIEASTATGELRVAGFEPSGGFMSDVTPATAVLDLIVTGDEVRRRNEIEFA
jgi:hypothetical protein